MPLSVLVGAGSSAAFNVVVPPSVTGTPVAVSVMRPNAENVTSPSAVGGASAFTITNSPAERDFLAQLLAQGAIAGHVREQHGDKLALAGQTTSRSEDFVAEVGRQVALELIEPVIE